MVNYAVYPGSFDPFTLGHKLIVDKALLLFDKVIIAIGENSQKRSFLEIEQRELLINKVYVGNRRVEVTHYSELTADFCRKRNIKHIVRGIRNVGDFEFERNIAQINQRLYASLETVFLMTPPEFSEISSGIVRDIIYHGGDPMQFMPEEITIDDLKSSL